MNKVITLERIARYCKLSKTGGHKFGGRSSWMLLVLFSLTVISLYSVAASAEFVLPPTTLQDPTPEEGARFGDSLAVGDVNGDGYDDVVVGAMTSDLVDDAGEAFLFLGPDLTTCDATLQDPDPEESALFGCSLAVGDVNGDEYDDIVVGAYGSDVDDLFYAGEVFLFLGGSSFDATCDATLQDPDPEESALFGCSLAVGDVNGDGYDDVVVGAYSSDVVDDAGEVFLFLGGSSFDATCDATLQSPTPEESACFGYSLAVGDVNGDEYDDVVVGAWLSSGGDVNDAGEVFLFLGGSSFDATCDATLQDPIPQYNAWFGCSLAVGDVNGDEYDDIVVGAQGSYVGDLVGAGEAFLFLGGSPFDTTCDATLQDPDPQEVALFGWSLAVGDVNGDEYDDIVVGAPCSDVDNLWYAGEAFLFLGGSSFDATCDATLQDPDPEGPDTYTPSFGGSLAVGDVNGDEYDDVAVSAVGSKVSEYDGAGEAFVFFSQPPTAVYVDIRPASWPNPINVRGRGVFAVAICGTEDFDVTTIDPATIEITMEGLGVSVSPLRWSYQDVATPYTGESGGHALGGDGHLDLVLHFKTQDVVNTLDLVAHGGETIPLIITGNLHDETLIQGQDHVWILMRK